MTVSESMDVPYNVLTCFPPDQNAAANMSWQASPSGTIQHCVMIIHKHLWLLYNPYTCET